MKCSRLLHPLSRTSPRRCTRVQERVSAFPPNPRCSWNIGHLRYVGSSADIVNLQTRWNDETAHADMSALLSVRSQVLGLVEQARQAK